MMYKIDATMNALLNLFSGIKIGEYEVPVTDESVDRFITDDIVGDDITIDDMDEPSIVLVDTAVTFDRSRVYHPKDKLVIDKVNNLSIPWPKPIIKSFNLELRSYRKHDELDLLGAILDIIPQGDLDVEVIFEFAEGVFWKPICRLTQETPFQVHSTAINNEYYGLQIAGFSIKTYLPVGMKLYDYPILRQRILRRTEQGDFGELAYSVNLDKQEDENNGEDLEEDLEG